MNKTLLCLLCVCALPLQAKNSKNKLEKRSAVHSLVAPYSHIKPLPEYAFGYYANSSQIKEIFENNDIKTVVEVGSWIGGGSTKHMGEMLRAKNGTLHAIDTWLGSTTQQVGQEHYQPVLSYVYQQFLSNMIHWGLTSTVVPCRMKSLEASQSLNVKPDLVYIDGEHTREAVYEDLVAWYPFVKDSGILCGDDWTWDSVREAVRYFAREQNLRIEASGNFWRLKK